MPVGDIRQVQICKMLGWTVNKILKVVKILTAIDDQYFAYIYVLLFNFRHAHLKSSCFLKKLIKTAVNYNNYNLSLYIALL